ncbi:hypothetical protein CJ030_MR5G017186 [Morella rubra]|uniref:Uncharacterized protein n=1 Tax=Morella rubra TaxID=262757 RepID=A0A6A1VMG6_9ROSI|nr:hypothetical protein CJ030_MR5G017186 [Morella rubra]
MSPVNQIDALKERQTCVKDSNCDQGLHCEACLANGNIRPRCTRIQPVSPTSKVKGLPLNRYSWLTTHNTFSRLGEKSAKGSVILSPTNQQDTITSQLNIKDEHLNLLPPSELQSKKERREPGSGPLINIIKSKSILKVIIYAGVVFERGRGPLSRWKRKVYLHSFGSAPSLCALLFNSFRGWDSNIVI